MRKFDSQDQAKIGFLLTANDRSVDAVSAAHVQDAVGGEGALLDHGLVRPEVAGAVLKN